MKTTYRVIIRFRDINLDIKNNITYYGEDIWKAREAWHKIKLQDRVHAKYCWAMLPPDSDDDPGEWEILWADGRKLKPINLTPKKKSLWSRLSDWLSGGW